MLVDNNKNTKVDPKKRMEELVKILNEASLSYEQKAESILSDFEYDSLYDELVALEEQTSIILANSPTQKVGFEVVSQLPKEQHEVPMLSLDKTKEVSELVTFLGEHEGDLSWKLDGLTVVLTYKEGTLQKAVTRGNGQVGEVITNNAKTFVNLPLKIPFKGELVLRGEAVITYSDFQKINDTIEDLESKYKNPRNLCSGSVRQLDSAITKNRHVRFYGFAVIRATLSEFENKNTFQNENRTTLTTNSRYEQMVWIESMGFETVHNKKVNSETVVEAVEDFKNRITNFDLPSDGLVLCFDNIEYGNSLGTTAKFPRDAIAFKWQDEIATTVLRQIEWSPSRTGRINPVAIFDPVELEGTTVSRASVHNLTILKELALGIGDMINVYKANMIIPQIASNETKSGNLMIPSSCPVCGFTTIRLEEFDSETLQCPNPNCPIKQIKTFEHFVSRDALNVEGLSEATIEKFVDLGFLKDITDLFSLEMYEEQIKDLDGFGEKSYHKLIQSINKAKKTDITRVVYGLGIAGVGLANAKLITKFVHYDSHRIETISEEELNTIDGIGPVIAKAYRSYFDDERNQSIYKKLVHECLEFEQIKSNTSNVFNGITFVITGKLEHYTNRKELQQVIENAGGKVASSVSAKTNYLINNDSLSSSAKNKKAKEMGVLVITEDEFNKMLE